MLLLLISSDRKTMDHLDGRRGEPGWLLSERGPVPGMDGWPGQVDGRGPIAKGKFAIANVVNQRENTVQPIKIANTQRNNDDRG